MTNNKPAAQASLPCVQCGVSSNLVRLGGIAEFTVEGASPFRWCDSCGRLLVIDELEGKARVRTYMAPQQQLSREVQVLTKLNAADSNVKSLDPGAVLHENWLEKRETLEGLLEQAKEALIGCKESIVDRKHFAKGVDLVVDRLEEATAELEEEKEKAGD